MVHQPMAMGGKALPEKLKLTLMIKEVGVDVVAKRNRPAVTELFSAFPG